MAVQCKIGILPLPGPDINNCTLGLDSNSTDDLILTARPKLSVYNDIQPLLLSPLSWCLDWSDILRQWASESTGLVFGDMIRWRGVMATLIVFTRRVTSSDVCWHETWEWGDNKPIQTRARVTRVIMQLWVTLGGLGPGSDSQSSEHQYSEINNNLPRDEEKVCPAAPERHSLTQKLLTRKTICL